MSESCFSCATFPEAEPATTNSVFKYLAALGLLVERCEAAGHYVASDLGRKVFARHGSFCILNSYQNFFQDLTSLLLVSNLGGKPVVNRFRNVLGSGQLHSRKFFSPALQMLAGRSFPFLVDLGCGNGQFLQQAIELKLARKLGGVDVSHVAVTATATKVGGARACVCLHAVEADAYVVSIWSKKLPWYKEAGLFSLWFVLHEFSRSDPRVVLRFLREINSRYPSAELILGELVKLPDHALANNRTESIMPEFLFFHELSGQGVLSWPEWQEIRRTMPFQVVTERYLDSILVEDGTTLPSSFIWHLKPF